MQSTLRSKHQSNPFELLDDSMPVRSTKPAPKPVKVRTVKASKAEADDCSNDSNNPNKEFGSLTQKQFDKCVSCILNNKKLGVIWMLQNFMKANPSIVTAAEDYVKAEVDKVLKAYRDRSPNNLRRSLTLTHVHTHEHQNSIRIHIDFVYNKDSRDLMWILYGKDLRIQSRRSAIPTCMFDERPIKPQNMGLDSFGYPFPESRAMMIRIAVQLRMLQRFVLRYPIIPDPVILSDSYQPKPFNPNASVFRPLEKSGEPDASGSTDGADETAGLDDIFRETEPESSEAAGAADNLYRPLEDEPAVSDQPILLDQFQIVAPAQLQLQHQHQHQHDGFIVEYDGIFGTDLTGLINRGPGKLSSIPKAIARFVKRCHSMFPVIVIKNGDISWAVQQIRSFQASKSSVAIIECESESESESESDKQYRVLVKDTKHRQRIYVLDHTNTIDESDTLYMLQLELLAHRIIFYFCIRIGTDSDRKSDVMILERAFHIGMRIELCKVYGELDTVTRTFDELVMDSVRLLASNLIGV